MIQQLRRTPSSCPPAFRARYTVQPGDTFYSISLMFRVRLEALAANNPHIPDPNILYPGDVLCVPGLITFPCCILMTAQRRLPFGSTGTASVVFAPRGGQAIQFAATLPPPNVLGAFDTYFSEVLIPDVGTFGNQLFPSPLDPPTWSTRIDLPTAASVIPGSRVTILPYSTLTGAAGPAALAGHLIAETCHA